MMVIVYHFTSTHAECGLIAGLSLPRSQRCMWVDCCLQLCLLLPHIYWWFQSEYNISQNNHYSFFHVFMFFFILFPTALYLTSENGLCRVVLISNSQQNLMNISIFSCKRLWCFYTHIFFTQTFIRLCVVYKLTEFVCKRSTLHIVIYTFYNWL